MLTSIQKMTSLINTRLEKEVFGQQPKELYDPISYILSIGGKRTRPMLTMLGYQLFKDDLKEVINPSLAVEIFHNFTLMHDDIMDQAPLRRGKATVHEKWNQHTAILSGDVMLVKAYEKLMDIPVHLLPVALKKFNISATEVCEGQQKDMLFESRADVTEEEYIDMIRQKTAVLLGFALELGAIIGEADEADQEHLRNFGIALGIGFQLKDDLLDVYGDANKFGKKPGGDIIANKKTYLLIKALEIANGTSRKELLDWLDKKDFNQKEKLKAVKSIYDKNKIKDKTELKIRFYYNDALRHLKAVKAPIMRKNKLKNLALQLVSREK